MKLTALVFLICVSIASAVPLRMRLGFDKIHFTIHLLCNNTKDNHHHYHYNLSIPEDAWMKTLQRGDEHIAIQLPLPPNLHLADEHQFQQVQQPVTQNAGSYGRRQMEFDLENTRRSYYQAPPPAIPSQPPVEYSQRRPTRRHVYFEDDLENDYIDRAREARRF